MSQEVQLANPQCWKSGQWSSSKGYGKWEAVEGDLLRAGYKLSISCSGLWYMDMYIW